MRVPRVAKVTREDGRSAHRGRVRQHKKGELPNTGATQEVPRSRGGYSREREKIRPAGARRTQGRYHVWERKAGKVFFVS